MFIFIFFVLYIYIFLPGSWCPFFFSTYTPMEVVPPVGMLVYTAVYTLAGDVAFSIHPTKITDDVLSVG